MTHSSPSGTARVLMPATSEPASGSVIPRQEFFAPFIEGTMSLVPSIKGAKISCLGITEPDAGSDVAGIKTRAVRDGDEWVINGSKTYITNGHRADYIVLVTKTDPDAGYDGFTLFLVPMDSPGVIREKRLSKMGMHASDTALLAFDDVRMPGSAVLGEVGKG